MVRSRVLSFMSAFGGPPKTSPGSSPSPQQGSSSPSPAYNVPPDSSDIANTRFQGRQREETRPLSILGGYGASEFNTNDTLPELLPIFNCLNSHSNKLYQEGYFLKLNDLDTQGRPYFDRSWTECFAQLVGTVLSLWDAAALDKAESDGEVPATFINLGDASIKMIETLETRSKDAAPLQNVLSISTAGKNRYLLHFSNVNALTQWTAGIRLAMFEHSSLHETYTGALIGGKGRALNNIRTIMTHSKFQTSDWVRVRFGAGTPWRRCWCVISPPDEKEVAKAQKTVKKKSSYDRAPVILKGNVKFYESKKITKKTHPIATITNAYAAYAIYPQSKALIDQSTLIKIEGNVTVHPQTQTKLESFIFVMPETHEAVSGVEMLLRFLFPIWDVFALYGRPQRLIPDTRNPKSLMFAMPKNDRWGYLDILDVTTLVTLPGSSNWSEAEWRGQLKKLTAERIEKLSRDPVRTSGRPSSQYSRPHRNSLPSRGVALKFADAESIEQRTSFDQGINNNVKPRSNTGATSPGPGILLGSPTRSQGHGRSVSASVPGSPVRLATNMHEEYHPSRLSREATRPSYDLNEATRPLPPPPPPAHAHPPALSHGSPQLQPYQDSSDDESRFHDVDDARAPPYSEQVEQDTMVSKSPVPVAPVAPPPAFSHQPGAKPQTRPIQSPELRRANSRMSSATLSQLAAAAGKQLPGSNGQASEEFKLEKIDDAYNRSIPNSDHTSNHTFPIDNNSAPFPEHFSNSESTNLQAPTQTFGRSPSPLRQMAALSPIPQAPEKSSYFSGNAYSAQEDQYLVAPRHGDTLLAVDDGDRAGRPLGNAFNRNSSQSPRRSRYEGVIAPEENKPVNSRNSSTGKITRKPIPPSPSRDPTEFFPPAETSPTEIMKSRDVNDALINRVNTVKSKISTSSRRYSEDESHYDSSPEHETQPLPAWPEDIPAAFREPQAGKPDIGDDHSQHTVGDDTYSPIPGPSSLNKLPTMDLGPTSLYGSDAHVDSRPGQAQFEGSSATNEARSTHSSTLSKADNNHLSSGLTEIPRSVPQETTPKLATTSPHIPPEEFAQDPAAATRVPVYAYTRPQVDSHENRQASYPLASNSGSASGEWSNQNLATAALDQQGVAPPAYFPHQAQETEHTPKANRSPHLSIERKPVSPGLPLKRHDVTADTRQSGPAPLRENAGNYFPQQANPRHHEYHQQQQYESVAYHDYEYTPPQPHYAVPGQFPITPQSAPPGWEQMQQQQDPYMQPQYHDYGRSMYGRQAPQNYYRQPQPQPTHNQNYYQYDQDMNSENRPYRG